MKTKANKLVTSGKLTVPRVKINLASPCYGGSYKASFVFSLVNLLKSWHKRNIGYSFSEVDTSDIELSRNILLSNFYYNKPDCSHILFIDNDMGFESSMINRMIDFAAEVVGVVSPRRQIDLKKLHAAGEYDFDKAMAKAVSFIASPSASNNFVNGFMEVNGCGAGIMLISRKCIDTMIEKCPEIVNTKDYKNLPFARDFEKFLTPFDKITSKGHRLSEDISFCHRWVEQCQGKIYANIDTNIKHIGEQIVESKYLDLIRK